MTTYRSLRGLAILVVLGLAIWATPIQALPTILNYVPSCDLIPAKNLMLQLNYYGYNFRDDATRNLVKTDRSLIYSLGYGFKKAEVGVDFIGDKRFSNTDSGLYAGPTAFNLKYRLLTQGTKNDKVSLVVGAFNLGSTQYNDAAGAELGYYRPSPYIMVGHAFKDFRVHLGYQWNILGYYWLDNDRKSNNDIIAGFDAVVIKDKKRPISLLVDYAGGPGRMISVGLAQTINPRWAWGVSFYNPIKARLPVSGVELPKQVWFGITHYIPL